MHYYSLNQQAPAVDFRAAALYGQAPDKGLYFPQQLPQLRSTLVNNLRSLTREELAFEVLKQYTGTTIPHSTLQNICTAAIDFPIPLISLSEELKVLELFQGPTLSFKDLGARFMSRCLSYFAQSMDKKIVVLVATSGDTGSAVADGFLGKEGIEVVILYPSGKVSRLQELQLTTLGSNIRAIEVEGNFDDCQSLVKTAFSDQDYQSHIFLTSANSINIARWLPQQLFYFFALQQWNHTEAPVIVVPSGNFGNIGAGILAKKTGLGCKQFIAACNQNDVVYRYLQSGVYQTAPTVHTCSNAMDVGNPSNFVRINELYRHDINMLRRELSASSVNDEQTAQAMQECWNTFNYVLDPHTAVAYHSWKDYAIRNKEAKGIIVSTAHPLKFEEWVKAQLNIELVKPKALEQLENRKKSTIKLKPEYKNLKDYLMGVYSRE